MRHADEARKNRLPSAAVNGIEAFPVEVEAEVNSGWGDTPVVQNSAFPSESRVVLNYCKK